MAVKEKKTGSQKKETGASGKKLRIKLVRSLVGRPRKQREVVRGLGLRRINSEVMRRDCPEVRGMVDKVSHLVNVEELDKK
ncbi:MAG: 50S ribosomal protein L30 [Candidatus Aminicenantes bacterium]|nr:50S ribosomal protein L30 [Candidatus Aminicenantes bacterium]